MGLRRVSAAAVGLVCLLAIAPSQTTSADHAPWVPEASAFGAAVGLMLALPNAFELAPEMTKAALAPRDDDTTSGIEPQTPSSAAPVRTNPYGLEATIARPGALWVKWRQTSADIDAATPELERCVRNIRRCSPAARKVSAIVRKAARTGGDARLALVNRTVNMSIAYTADTGQWQTVDKWSAPLDAKRTGSFNTGKGDCEDYAIAKYVVLRAAGVADTDLQLLMVRDKVAGIDHAVLAARSGERWLLLDNRWSRLLEESDTAFFTPLFALNGGGVMRFERGGDAVASLARPATQRLASSAR